MASASDIAEVRRNTNQPENVEPYTDDYVGGLIDEIDVAGASAAIWREKAAKYAELVTTKEGSATENFSDLHKQALTMAAEWDALTVVVVDTTSRPRVKKIVRS